MATGKRWTRDELLVLLNVYEKLPFGQFDEDQKVVQDIAKRMNRSSGSVAMKLCNLASLDPKIRARGRSGLTGASNLDREVWAEFQAHRDILAPQSEAAFRNLFSAKDEDDVDLVKGVGVRVQKSPLAFSGPTETTTEVSVRRGQQFFRQLVLNAFDNQCCVTGIRVRELLIASHIKPWKPFPNERLDPQNGLSLSRIHDAAFDRGLIAFDESYRLVLSKSLKRHFPHTTLEHNFLDFEGRSMIIPVKSLAPSQTFLGFHREHIFRG